MQNKEVYFCNSIGVFQGGGCKAIAYVGAYKAAVRHGVMFSEVAGTSAGSIFAALIAAGATPEFIERKVLDFDFTEFLKPARINGIKSRIQKIGWFARKYISFGMRKIKKLAKESNFPQHDRISFEHFVETFGLFDSALLESKINDWLKELTGNDHLCFGDLRMPLYIVASDVQDHCVKVWSSVDKECQKESVAKAVTASCSIPGFFTPVDKRYVDGGMISNRPDFLFSTDDQPHYFQIMSFRLQSDSQKSTDKIENYIMALFGTIIDGADDIQHKLNNNANELRIKLSIDIKATDFNKLTQENKKRLINDGAKAVDQFFSTSPGPEESNLIETPHIHLHSLEQVYSEIAFWSNEDIDEVLVNCRTLDWCWPLFPTILNWIRKGIKVIVMYEDIDSNENAIKVRMMKKQAQNTVSGTSQVDIAAKVNRNFEKLKVKTKAIVRMLNAFGCMTEHSDFKIQGFFIRRKEQYFGVVYDDDNNFTAKIYPENIDSMAIKALVESFKVTDKIKALPVPTAKLAPATEVEIIKRLKTIPYYKNATLSYEQIDLSVVLLLNRYARALKYRQIHFLLDAYKNAGLDPYRPAKVEFADGRCSLMSPVVVEEHHGKLVVIKGNSRCLYAYKHDERRLNAVVIRNVKEELPTDSKIFYTLDKVAITENRQQEADRYPMFNYSHYRPVESAVRPTESYLK